MQAIPFSSGCICTCEQLNTPWLHRACACRGTGQDLIVAFLISAPACMHHQSSWLGTLCRFARGLCRVCYQLQRRLLLDGKDEFPRRSLRSLHAPAVVVYVVVPSDALADVSQSLLLCSQALAPCTSLGLAEAQQQFEVNYAASSIAAEPAPPLASGDCPVVCTALQNLQRMREL